MKDIDLNEIKSLAVAVYHADTGSSEWDRATDALNEKNIPAGLVWLIDQLEVMQRERDEYHQRLANAEHQLEMAELAKFNLRAQRKAQFRKRREAEAELKRRDAQEPYGYVAESPCSSGYGGMMHEFSIDRIDAQHDADEHEGFVIPLYAASPAAVPEKVVKLPRSWLDDHVTVMSWDDVTDALDASGVKFEVTGEKSD